MRFGPPTVVHGRRAESGGGAESVLVVVAVMGGVPVAVVHVVDMVAVRDRDVAAAFLVGVLVTVMRVVRCGLALVVVAVVRGMQVPVVHIVDVITVGYRDVAAAIAVRVVVTGVFNVGGGHLLLFPSGFG